jgi:deazaflavin-dependent oxidoreductase (nitroreductase family)
MPLPAALGRFNLRVTNPILRPVAARLPGFAIVEHVGRRTGIVRRTPVSVFGGRDRRIVPLTYGREAQWVRNVVAAGHCLLVERGRAREMVDPRIVHDPGRRALPPPVRIALGVIGVDDFLELEVGSPVP